MFDIGDFYLYLSTNYKYIIMNIVSRKEILRPGYQKSDFKIKNYKITPEGCSGQVMICDELTDWVVFNNTAKNSKEMLDEVWEDYITDYPETDLMAIGQSIESFGEEVDNSLEQTTEGLFFMSRIDILRKNGFEKGIILKRGSEEDFIFSHGIFTGDFQHDEWGNIVLLFTDGELVREEYCTIITDVNKGIIRYITNEKERMMEELITFQNIIDEKLHAVIFD